MKRIIDEKLVKFICVGICNTLIGSAVMFGLYNLCGVSYWISSAANYIVGSVFSYFLNKHFTFRHRGRTMHSMIRFVLNIAVCYGIAYGVAKPLAVMIFAGLGNRVQENIAMLVGMCIFTGLNYLGQRFVVFREEIS